MSNAIKNLTKDTVIPRTGTFLHKTEKDSKKVKAKNITQLSKYCLGNQAYCWRRCNEN